jgi:DNA polymerase III delta prime subunit
MSFFEHHAYLVLGGKNASLQIKDDLEKSGFKTEANPDFRVEHYLSLGIDEARVIKELDLRNSIGDRKIFIISYDSVTREAQNALLKTFEEPSGRSIYFLCVDREDELLPTLRSRLIRYNTPTLLPEPDQETNDFLHMELDERMVFAHELSEDIKKKKKTKKNVEDFLNSLEFRLSREVKNIEPEKLRHFLELKSLAGIKGSSVKNVIEAISIILPRM